MAVVLQHEGRLEEALDRLRSKGTACAALSGKDPCCGPLRLTCGYSRANFVTCNPAFASKNGTGRFRAAALKFEIELLTELGGQEVARATDSLQSALAHWREALDLAHHGEQRDQTAARIRELTLGRSSVLKEKKQFDA